MLLSLITALSVTVSSSASRTTSFSKGLEEYSQLATGQAAFFVRQQLDIYEGVSFQFVANQDLNSLLSRYVLAASLHEVSAYNRTFSNFVEGHAFSNEGILDAFFVDEAVAGRTPLTMSEVLPSAFVASFMHSQPYMDTIKADGKPIWSASTRITPTGPNVLLLSRRIKHLFSNNPLGVLVMLIDASSLAQRVRDYLGSNFYFSVGTIKSHYITILDSLGRVVSAADPIVDDKPAWLLEFMSQPTPARQGGAASGGSMVSSIDGEELLVSFRPIEGTDWRVFVPVLPNGVFLSQEPAKPQNIPVAALIGGAALGIAVTAGAVLSVRKVPRLANGFAVGAPGVVSMGVTTLASGIPADQHPALPEAPGVQASCDVVVDRSWIEALTPRERTILMFISQGLSNKEIAQRMFVAEQTMKNYVSTIYDKIGVRDRVQASLMALKAGLTVEEGAETGPHDVIPRTRTTG